MDLTAEKTAIGSLLLLVVGFLVRWGWERFWKSKDTAIVDEKAAEKARDTKVEAIEQRMQVVERRIDAVGAEAGSTAHKLGMLEATQNRLDGKVDGLQKHWTARFDKLEDEMKEGFRSLNDKVEYKLDMLRSELRGDQQGSEERILKIQMEHQKRVHDRLDAFGAAQAQALNQFFDRMLEDKSEPRPSPVRPGGT